MHVPASDRVRAAYPWSWNQGYAVARVPLTCVSCHLLPSTLASRRCPAASAIHIGRRSRQATNPGIWNAASVFPAAAIALAEAQLGVLVRRQLLAWLTETQADSLFRGRRFERIEFGVHRVVGGARPPSQRAIAATLRSGPGATLTGPIVLALYGIDGFGDHDPFEVLLPPGRRSSGVAFRVRRDPDPGRPVARRGEVRLTGAVDALIDSAAAVHGIEPRRLRLAHDVLRWRGLLAPGRLAARIHELGRGAPGGPALAELFELDTREAVGHGERSLGDLLAAFDPAPEPQVWVTPHRRVDWWFRSLRYGFEYQGSVDHTTLAGRIADADRDLELARDDIRLGYVTAADLRDVSALMARIASALVVRAHERGCPSPRFRGG
jgi:hypothetical protein